jgi:multicomponent Na+:H+ antiporter subunit B
MMSVIVIDLILFGLLVLTALAIVKLTNLFAVTMLAGLFSLLAAALFITMDAVDVAFTEAAVGAGISTVLMLGALALTAREEKPLSHSVFLPLLCCIVTGAALIYGTLDMPDFGSPTSPVQAHVGGAYLERVTADTGVPNVVTAVLASYRGYDTLGEVTVIFVAAISVLLLIGYPRRRKSGDE